MIPSPTPEGFEEILTPDALAFVGDLVREFSLRLDSLLQKRILAHARLRTGTLPNFLDETREIRTSEWKVGQIPAELRQRRVEITGPVDRKMVINALNSGADPTSTSPSWKAIWRRASGTTSSTIRKKLSSFLTPASNAAS